MSNKEYISKASLNNPSRVSRYSLSSNVTNTSSKNKNQNNNTKAKELLKSNIKKCLYDFIGLYWREDYKNKLIFLYISQLSIKFICLYLLSVYKLSLEMKSYLIGLVKNSLITKSDIIELFMFLDTVVKLGFGSIEIIRKKVLDEGYKLIYPEINNTIDKTLEEFFNKNDYTYLTKYYNYKNDKSFEIASNMKNISRYIFNESGESITDDEYLLTHVFTLDPKVITYLDNLPQPLPLPIPTPTPLPSSGQIEQIQPVQTQFIPQLNNTSNNTSNNSNNNNSNNSFNNNSSKNVSNLSRNNSSNNNSRNSNSR